MFSVQDILSATGGRLISGDSALTVESVGIDSRTIPGNALFIAIKGEKFDGHDFVASLYRKGVRVFCVHRAVKVPKRCAVIKVDNTTIALGDLANFHRRRFKIPIIGITGSAGKTTTKEMIAAVLRQKYCVLANEGTLNNHIGVPLTLFQLNRDHQAAVIEMGTNQPGDIAWLTKIAAPTIAVLTNIGESHLEKLKNLQGVYREKSQLAKSISSDGVVIFNADDPWLSRLQSAQLKAKRISFSIKNKSDYQAKLQPLKKNQGIRWSVNKKSYLLRTFSQSMTYNALVAIICGQLLKVSNGQIKAALSQFQFTRGRQEVVNVRGIVMINDSYNANPVSMRSAVEMISHYPVKGRRICVCADMLELGDQSKSLHEKVGEWVAQSQIDVLMTLGDQARWLLQKAQAIRPNLVVFHFSQIENLKSYLSVLCQKGDVVLVKGSRRMKMETVIDGLRKDLGC